LGVSNEGEGYQGKDCFLYLQLNEDTFEANEFRKEKDLLQHIFGMGKKFQPHGDGCSDYCERAIQRNQQIGPVSSPCRQSSPIPQYLHHRTLRAVSLLCILQSSSGPSFPVHFTPFRKRSIARQQCRDGCARGHAMGLAIDLPMDEHSSFFPENGVYTPNQLDETPQFCSLGEILPGACV
jgi:hypothetical protein